jgi:hypothetical protein
VFSQFPRCESQYPNGGFMGYALRTKNHRLVRWVIRDGASDPRRLSLELYDHRRDPHESVNIARDPTNSNLVRQLEAQCAAGWQASQPMGDARHGSHHSPPSVAAPLTGGGVVGARTMSSPPANRRAVAPFPPGIE